ncbi:UNVERIFIED_CONTAM: hypothetical protein FKN15_013878 [Acipenser sinensis]
MFTRVGEVEGAVMDVYDFLYHDFLRNQSDSAGQHLTAFHTVFSCCGKHSRSPLTGPVESITCPAGLRVTGQGCLLAVSASLQKHMDWCWALLLLMMAAVVSGMILTSFLFFSIRLGVSETLCCSLGFGLPSETGIIPHSGLLVYDAVFFSCANQWFISNKLKNTQK